MRWDEYHKSEAWLRLKNQAMIVAGYRCQCGEGINRCINTTQLELHHDKYPYIPRLRPMLPEFYDTIDNVRILCRDCHETFHICNKDYFGNLNTYYSDIRDRANAAANVCDHPVDETDISDLVGDNK